MTKQIAVITGTRAEYGLLVPVLDAIEAHDELELNLIVTGTHLTTNSVRDIRHRVAVRVKMQRTGAAATREEDVQSLGRGVMAIGRALHQMSPDVVVVLGDRIEALAGALAAQVGGFRLAHIHGGDRAEGVADEAMRHAISKLAHLHLCATTQSKRRLIRMGEHKAHVHHTGSPAIDGLKGVKPDGEAPELIIMQHPVGATPDDEYQWMLATLEATARHNRLILEPNHDSGRNAILRAILDSKLTPTEHLPRDRFLSLLAGCQAIVGNSSAGLIEAAALKTPAVNLGTRQAGREKPGNVIDAKHTKTAAQRAIKEALEMKTAGLRHPYGNGKAGQKIAALLAKVDLAKIPLHKHNAY
ncbi:MAG: UDP-N-acetylglucosamine 2-epimerase (hydrolyzing) [Phycisphaeraceae bacterium]|nr:UDP-N-acetylglucosamine 2-epimerase (hydrolyzing) [Phycisphaeraceae bacterium]